MTIVNNAMYDGRCILEIEGHACPENNLGGYKMPTSDYLSNTGDSLACAALSILVITVTEKLKTLESEGAFRKSVINIESGYAFFDLDVYDEYVDEVTNIIDTVMLGVEMLEENYPDCVSIR